MKHHLRYTFLACGIFIFLSVASCKKEKPFQNNATLIGFDVRACPCCGGLKIVIDNVPSPNGDFFLVDTLPAEFELGDNPAFPILVKIDWKIGTQCLGNYVEISRIARR